MKRQQLREIGVLYRNKKNNILKEDFNTYKNYIKINAKEAINKILEELSYNTSFIVSKYKELADLKDHQNIKDINKQQKAELKIINKKIRHEKYSTNKKLTLLISSLKANNADKEKIAEFKATHKMKYKKIQDKYQTKMEQIEDGLLKSRKTSKYFAMTTTIAIAVPSLLLIGLLTNYLIYLPYKNGTMTLDFTDINRIIAFVLSMIMIVLALSVTVFILKNSVKRMVLDREKQVLKLRSIGFMASFFDVFGVGCFATSLGGLKITKTIDDDRLTPGTLNLAFILPILIEGAFVISAVKVDIVTLIILVTCAVIGSYIGSSIVNKVNAKVVKISISFALLMAGFIMIFTTPQVAMLGGSATDKIGLELNWEMVVGILGFLLVGILMSFGVGSYATSIAILGLLGVNILAIFPIMLSSSAFLMPLASYKYYKSNNYLPKTSLNLMLGGIFGATVGFLVLYVGLQIGLGMDSNGIVFKSVIKWSTIGVMFYSSVTMFWEFLKLIRITPQREQITKRKSLNDLKNNAMFKSELQLQMNNVVNKYANGNFDTKAIVEKEKITITKWIAFNNKKQKTQI